MTFLKNTDVTGTHCAEHNKTDSEIQTLHIFLFYTELEFKIMYVGMCMYRTYNF